MGTPEEVGLGDPEEVGVDGPEEASPKECIIPDGFLKNGLVAASVGAGAIHLWTAWAHSNWTKVLVFFVVVAALQLWLAAVVQWVRSIPWSLLIGGAVANAAVVVVWILTRTTGMPGYNNNSHHMDMQRILEQAANSQHLKGFVAHKETFGIPDTMCSLLEIGFIVAVLMLVRQRHRSPSGESGDDGRAAVATSVAEDSAGTGPPIG
jgi:hypothetical protein